MVTRNAAISLFNEGRFDAAAHSIESDLDMRRQLYPDSTTLATSLLSKAQLSMETGHYDAAVALLDEADKTERTALGADAQPVTRNRFLLARARLHLYQGQPERAIEALNAISAPAAAAGTVSLDRVRANNLRAATHLRQGRVQEAIASASAARAELSDPSVRGYYQTLEADAALQLGKAYLRAADAAAAPTTTSEEEEQAKRYKLGAPTGSASSSPLITPVKKFWVSG